MRGFALGSAFALVTVGALAFAPRAHATVRPPTDTLTVELKWLDRTSPTWRARVRLVRYSTQTVAPGPPVHTALSLRVPDSLVITGIDSALVVLPGTQVAVPGYPTLRPHVPAQQAFRAHPAAPAGGFWRGAMASVRTASVLPNDPVDVCWFLQVAAGTSEGALLDKLQETRFGSGPANAAAVLGSGVQFKLVGRSRPPSGTGGGSDPIEPKTLDP